MNHSKILQVAALVLVISLTPNLQTEPLIGLTYYVDNVTGNDNNTGLSPQQPFKTIDRGIRALDSSGGDTMLIKGGKPYTTNLTDSNYIQINNIKGNSSGSSPPKITKITGVPDTSGRLPEIDGGFPYGDPIQWPTYVPKSKQSAVLVNGERKVFRAISINNSSYIDLSGFIVYGVGEVVCLIWWSDNITIQNCEFSYSGGPAIKAGPLRILENLPYTLEKIPTPQHQGLLIYNNKMSYHNLGYYNLEKSVYGFTDEALSVDSYSNAKVCSNTLTNTLKEGMSAAQSSDVEFCHNDVSKNTASSIYLFAGNADIKIHHNKVSYGGFFEVPPRGTQPATLYLSTKYLNIEHAKLTGKQIYPRVYVPQNGSGIALNNGDAKNGATRIPVFELGVIYDIDIFSNEIFLCLGSAIHALNYNYSAYCPKTGGPSSQNYYNPNNRVENVRIFNNTCYLSNISLQAPLYTGPPQRLLAPGLISLDPTMEGTVVANNILVESKAFEMTVYAEKWGQPAQWASKFFSAQSNNQISNNLFFNNLATVNFPQLRTKAVTEDPLFSKNPAIKFNPFMVEPYDFYLTIQSPARENGVNMGQQYIGLPDLGAYEYGLPRWQAGYTRKQSEIYWPELVK